MGGGENGVASVIGGNVQPRTLTWVRLKRGLHEGDERGKNQG